LGHIPKQKKKALSAPQEPCMAINQQSISHSCLFWWFCPWMVILVSDNQGRFTKVETRLIW
jgi:hypothetical protein